MEEQYNNTPPQEQEILERKEGGSTGPLVGIVIIIIILILGALYYWGSYLNQQPQDAVDAVIDTLLNEDIAAPSDEPAIIESDLNTFDTADFDAQLEADLKALESEF